MKPSTTPPTHPRGRRIAGRAQEDHIQDPYARKGKYHDGTRCPSCSAVYKAGRWQWAAPAGEAPAQTCPACRRIADRMPAGVVTLTGPFALEHKSQLLELARNQEAAEKDEHPLNRIMAVEENGTALTISTTDIHLPRRIGEAVGHAFHGDLDLRYDEDGYFVRVTWRREV